MDKDLIGFLDIKSNDTDRDLFRNYVRAENILVVVAQLSSI